MEDVKFYNKPWFMWVMLFIVPPVGIFLVWKSGTFKTPIKVVLSIVFCIWFFGMISIGLDDSGSEVNSASKPVASENKKPERKPEKKQEEVKTLKINETYNHKDEYEFVITKVYTTKDRNQFADKEAKNVVIIDYSYKNISKKDTLFISQLNFKAFDASGNALDTYPVSGEDTAKAIPSGKSSKGSMTYALNEGNSIDLYYYDNMFSSKEDVVFKVNIGE